MKGQNLVNSIYRGWKWVKSRVIIGIKYLQKKGLAIKNK